MRIYPRLQVRLNLTVTEDDEDNTADAEVEIVTTPVGTNVAPVFTITSCNFSLASDAADGAVVGTVSAMDSNAGAMLTYSLSGTGAGHFAISNTPVASCEEVTVTLAANADMSSLVSPVTITATVSDGPLMADATVETTVVAGNVAPVFANTGHNFNIASDAAGGTVVGTVSAMDSNAGAMLTYSLSGTGAGHFAISNTPVASCEEVTVTVAENADMSSLVSPGLVLK